ncbi:chemotaxis protein CheA [Patescibacteria group bacterium]|nr:chemotaxis protein CheA [Patescibacteria group bacterium]
MSEQDQYKKLFIQESDELLQDMNKNLLILEKEPENTDSLNAIFRSAHTLKGMCASMGYTKIVELAHKMENVLEQLRRSAIDISDKVVDLLFKSFDSLESMVGAVQEDRQFSGDIQPLLISLDNIMIKTPQIKEEKITDGLSLNVFEKNTLARVKKEGYSCYHIKVTLDKNCVLKSVRAFMVFRNLHTIGEVVKSIPAVRDLEEEKFEQGFDCIFITREEKGNVKRKVLEVLDIENVEVKEMPIQSSWEKERPEKPFITDHAEDAPLSSGEHMRRIRSVRVDINRLDKLMNLVEELAISKLRLTEISSESESIDLKGIIEEFSRLTDELQTEVMQARLVPVSQVFDRFPRLVRDLARKENKQVKFEIVGGDIELDRTILDEIGDPLIHLLRNAIDHGIEAPDERKKKGKPEEGSIILSAKRERGHVFIDVKDDGKGIDIGQIKKIALKRKMITEEEISSMSNEEILFLAARPGISTKKEVTDLSGRGVGLDAAREKTKCLGGGISIESEADKGCRIILRLPLTTVVLQALLVKVLDRVFAIPMSSIVEIIVIRESDIKKVERQETILHRDRVIPVARLEKLFSRTAYSVQRTAKEEGAFEEKRNTHDAVRRMSKLNIVIVEFSTKQFGIVVEGLIGQQDIVIKQLTKELKGIRGFAGATILGDGSVALVLDVATLV